MVAVDLPCDDECRVPAELLVLVAGMVPSPGETGEQWWVNTGYEDLTRAQDAHDDIALVDAPRRAGAVGITPDEIDGGHCVALSRPKELADRLEAYAQAATD